MNNTKNNNNIIKNKNNNINKNKKNNNINNQKKKDNESLITKYPLQALILLNNLKNDINSFYPLTLNKSKELIPIINIPMIQYIIENLIESDVKEIIIIGNEKTGDIENYINEFEWDIKIDYICMDSNYINELEVLRKIEEDKIIKSDPFILISGDIVTNLNIKKVIDIHNQIIKEKKDCMMTLCFHRVKEFSNKKSGLEEMRICLNNDNRIIYYKNDLFQSDYNNLTFDSTCIHNIIDCHIDICSQSFLLRINDEFDYQNLREQFIVSEVTNQDFGRGIYAYLIEDSYAVKIHEPKIFHKVSMDIINGKIKNYDLEKELFTLDNDYQIYDSNIYIEKSAKIESSSIIHSSTLIGKNTKIGKNVSITNCIIGENCIIDDNVEITNSHIFNNSIIKNNVKICYSIIGENCTINKNSKIDKGSIIGENMVINENTHVNAFSRLSSYNIDEENNKIDELIPCLQKNTLLVKDDRFVSMLNEPMETIIALQLEGVTRSEKIIKSPSIRKITSIGCFYDDKQEFKNMFKQEIEKNQSKIDLKKMEESNFDNQLIYFIENLELKNINPIELKCLILAENKTKIECLKIIMINIWNKNEENKNNILKMGVEFKKYIEKYKKSILIIFDDSDELGLSFIENILEDTIWYENKYELFFYLIHIFYQNDFINDDIIRCWIQLSELKNNPVLNEPKTIEFINWFNEFDISSDNESDKSYFSDDNEEDIKWVNINDLQSENDDSDSNCNYDDNNTGLDIFDDE